MQNSKPAGAASIPLYGTHPETGARGHVVGFALVDAADAPTVMRFRWNRMNAGYARTNLGKRNPLRAMMPEHERSSVMMHQLVMGCLMSSVIDHINQNKLDNRRCNLRVVSKSENAINSKVRNTNTSGFRGVSWESQTGKWRATVNQGKKRISAGRYDCAVEAALAADWAAWQLYREQAILNFPERIIR